MIGSGLAGTTVMGGMQAGVTEAATRAKANVAAGARQQTNQLGFQYANLAQAASEGALNRAAGVSEGALNRSFQGSQAALNRSAAIQQQDIASQPPSNASQGLDIYGRPMKANILAEEISGSAGPAAAQTRYPNLGMVGQTAPRLY